MGPKPDKELYLRLNPKDLVKSSFSFRAGNFYPPDYAFSTHALSIGIIPVTDIARAEKKTRRWRTIYS